MTDIKCILCATDFSPPSIDAFQFACSLARDYRARLILVHVKPREPLATGVMAMEPEPPEIRDELKKQLDAITPSVPGVKLERVLIVGEAVPEILRLANEKHCSLIVLGTHGRTGLRRLLMGSVAEAVLREAPCAVLTVRESRAKA